MVVVLKLINQKFLHGVELLKRVINYKNKISLLSRSSFKGYWYCRHVPKQIYRLISKKKKAVSFFLKRSSTIPNYLTTFMAKIESGTLLKKKRMPKLLSGFKVGQIAFTRKPYFYPFKKLKGKR